VQFSASRTKIIGGPTLPVEMTLVSFLPEP
jgi:hypothetical protein